VFGLQRARHQARHGLPYYTNFARRLRDAFEGFEEIVEELLAIDALLLAERAGQRGQCKPDLHVQAIQWGGGVVSHLWSKQLRLHKVEPRRVGHAALRFAFMASNSPMALRTRPWISICCLSGRRSNLPLSMSGNGQTSPAASCSPSIIGPRP